MPPKKSSEVSAFIAALPPERRVEFERVHEVICDNLPAGYEEVLGRNMVVWQIPLQQYPDTYNRQPFMYAALANQKSGLSLHVMSMYADAATAERVKDAFARAGKKPDLGKACIRFKRASDLPLDTIGEVVAAMPPEKWVAIGKAARQR